MGKRSGDGFIAHKAKLINALSRALSERVELMDFTIGRKGLLGYLKALGGSNIVKVVPSNGSASGVRAADKRLKITCGANTSYIADNEWIGEKTPLSFCEVRISPNNTVKPNIGSLELSEALNRVLPFTAKEDNRPVLQCVLFMAKEGKLTLVSADGFRLAIISLDYDDTAGQALIYNSDLAGIASALKSAKRARIGFEGEDVTKPSTLTIDTELIRYKWASNGGNYPEYEKLIPTQFNTYARFDTLEAIRAASSLKALSDDKDYPIDLTIGNGKIVMASPDEKGQVEIVADTDGEEGYVRVNGKYLADTLKACDGMVDFSLTNSLSPMLFSQDGYQVVVMPMVTDRAQKEAKATAQDSTEAEPVAEPVTDKTTEAEVKPKQSRKKEKIAVA